MIKNMKRGSIKRRKVKRRRKLAVVFLAGFLFLFRCGKETLLETSGHHAVWDGQDEKGKREQSRNQGVLKGEAKENQTLIKQEIDTSEKKPNNTQGQQPVDSSAQTEYVDSIAEINVERPVDRSYEETLQKLKKLGHDNSLIEEIYQNEFLYPEVMLTALANNPEMANFVAGYLNNDKNGFTQDNSKDIEIGFTQKELESKYPLLLQWDPRWGYQKYGSSFLGIAGCGPTCLSMVFLSMLGEESMTPAKIANYSMEEGYYVEGAGTSWALMSDLPQSYGLQVNMLSLTEDAIKAQLDRGGLVICSMGKGDFTVAGHFVVIYSYDKNGFYINDPNCVARSRRTWTFEEIGGQIKNIWGYSKGLSSSQQSVVSFYEE